MVATKQDWQETAAAKRASLLASLPSQWVIPQESLPPEGVLNVTTFPKSSGLFTNKEIQMTAAGVVDIVDRISKGIWRAEEVTVAFCKAATVAHQLVG
jgi:amidase